MGRGRKTLDQIGIFREVIAESTFGLQTLTKN